MHPPQLGLASSEEGVLLLLVQHACRVLLPLPRLLHRVEPVHLVLEAGDARDRERPSEVRRHDLLLHHDSRIRDR